MTRKAAPPAEERPKRRRKPKAARSPPGEAPPEPVLAAASGDPTDLPLPGALAPPLAESPLAPPLAEAPLAESPLAAAPLADPPLAEAPLVEAPLAEVPLAAAPLAAAPLAEAPLAEAPLAAALLADPPPAETPLAEAPLAEALRAEAPAADALPPGRFERRSVTPMWTAGDEPEAISGRRFTVFLVPDGGRGPLRQFELSLGQIRGLLSGLGAVLLLGLLGLVLLVLGAPVVRSREALLAENIRLRSQMQDVERKMFELDGQLRRLRLYNTQLQDLPLSGLPGFGPVSPSEAGQALWLGRLPLGQGMELMPEWEPGMPMEEPLGAPLGEMVAAGDLSEAEVRALELSLRSDRLLAALRRIEPEAQAMVETVAEWQRRQDALPTLLPVRGSVLTSNFGWRRAPFTRQWKFHAGVDIAAPPGTPVYAAGAGVVRTVDWHGGYGRLLEIDHGDGLMSRYAHNRSILVKEGQRVAKGELVSTIGMTGLTTGPHLHLEIHVDGVAVDPLAFIERP